MGELIDGCDTIFYNITFPHGNAIKSIDKVRLYMELKDFLEE